MRVIHHKLLIVSQSDIKRRLLIKKQILLQLVNMQDIVHKVVQVDMQLLLVQKLGNAFKILMELLLEIRQDIRIKKHILQQ